MFGFGRRKTEKSKITGAVRDIAFDLHATRKDISKLYAALRKSVSREAGQTSGSFSAAVKSKPFKSTAVAMGLGAVLAVLFVRT